MGTLWTPSGEHEPEPAQPAPPGRPPGAPSGREPAPGAAPAEPTPEELAAVRELHAELRAAPVEDVIANHAVGLFQLALIHLGIGTPPDDEGRVPAPDLAGAATAVDAFAALVEGLGARLGRHQTTLSDALAQIRTAYVQVSDAVGDGAPED